MIPSIPEKSGFVYPYGNKRITLKNGDYDDGFAFVMIGPRLIRLAAASCLNGLSAGPGPQAARMAAAAAAAVTSASSTSTTARTRQSSPQLKTCRWSHTLPELNLNESHGVPGLLSPQGFKLAWTDYQRLLLTRLNSMVQGVCH